MGESMASKDGGARTLASEPDELGYRRALPQRALGAGFSTDAPGASANGPPTGSLSGGPRLDSRMDRSAPLLRRLPDLGLALKTIIAFWAFYLALTTTRALVIDAPGQVEMLRRRLFVLAVAIILSYLVYLVLQRVRDAPIRTKIIVAALACLPASMALAAANHYFFYVHNPLDAVWVVMRDEDMADKSLLRVIGESTHSWFFFFAAWAALYVAMSYARQAREADARAAILSREAQESQLRALRYQINPHFLFNTLNSLSSLVLAQRNDTAERMLMNLSAFFRATLSADPTADVPLSEEIALQRLYLEIEQIRFPERLRVAVDVPEPLLAQRVPVLILQPIVENAVKYGVARSRRPVTIAISAYQEAGRIHIKVKDDGDHAPEAGEGGTGVGLANVCDRLVARYGKSAGCWHGPDPGGGYTVHLFMPVSEDD
jgi:two-component system, LytTR family, sensor kinase